MQSMQCPHICVYVIYTEYAVSSYMYVCNIWRGCGVLKYVCTCVINAKFLMSCNMYFLIVYSGKFSKELIFLKSMWTSSCLSYLPVCPPASVSYLPVCLVCLPVCVLFVPLCVLPVVCLTVCIQYISPACNLHNCSHFLPVCSAY